MEASNSKKNKKKRENKYMTNIYYIGFFIICFFYSFNEKSLVVLYFREKNYF